MGRAPVVGLLAVAALACACTSSLGGTPTGAGLSSGRPTSTTPGAASGSASVRPTSHAAPPTHSAPLSTGPTTAATATSCPLLALSTATDRIGMRLARISVLRAGGKIVGCRFYAVQGTTFDQSEHLPGPNQPAIEIATTRYSSAVAAHNGFVVLARAGRNPMSETIGPGNRGVCFQTTFYAPDRGHDWACAFSVGRQGVVIRTVVTSPALTVLNVARIVAPRV